MKIKKKMYGRAVRKVDRDLYKTGDQVAQWVKKLSKRYGKNTTFIDPCAGHKDLYDMLPTPKRAFDKFPTKGVRKLDFLKSRRRHFVSSGRMTIVMNPPFSLRGQKNGVVAFLNHAASIMRVGETVICVSPQTMRRWVNISKVDKRLRLLKEIVFRKPQPFRTKSGGVSSVSVCVQVWRLSASARREPAMLTSSPDFKVVYYDDASRKCIFINRWGMADRIGSVSTKAPLRAGKNRFKCRVGTLSIKGGTGKTVIPAKGKYQKVLRRLQKLYSSGRWKEYVKHTCAGNNNPAVVSTDIYTLYAKGLTYLQKKSYGIAVRYV